jgi:hypothetical protein
MTGQGRLSPKSTHGSLSNPNDRRKASQTPPTLDEVARWDGGPSDITYELDIRGGYDL